MIGIGCRACALPCSPRRDAHSLYERFGSEVISDRLMMISNPAEALYGSPAEKLTE